MMRRRFEQVRSTDAGVVAVWVAIMAPLLFMFCAFAVDVARWYVEGERLQKTVDAAALAGVPYLPQDFGSADTTARDLIGRNGFSLGPRVTAQVSPGDSPSQLKVTMTSVINNNFATVFGFATQSITRSAVADFTGPAPLGSPCNTFANEPSGSTASQGVGPRTALPTTPYPNCNRNPQFWATAVGPYVAKTQGDRFLAQFCGGTESGCESGAPQPNCAFPKHTSLAGLTDECKEDAGERGYVYAVKVFNPSTVTSVNLQLYDPAYVDTGSDCSALPSPPGNNPNSYTNDGNDRYRNNATPISSTVPSFCSGDNDNRSTSGDILSFASNSKRNDADADEIPTITSFGLLKPTDTFNPFDPQANASAGRVPGCSTQFPGYSLVGGRWVASTGSTTPTGANASAQLSANNALTRVFHQWVSLCSFNPSLYVSAGSKEATFYLRVRTNVALGSDLFTQAGNNPSVRGNGSNRFSLRAVAADPKSVGVSAFERMPIFANTVDADTTFNLVRITPGSAGQNLVFSFYDVGDATGGSGARLQILRPTDASGSGLSDCRTGLAGRLPAGQTLANCEVTGIASTGTASTTWNGKYQQIVVPIPANYSCSFQNSDGTTNQGGCWFRVRVRFSGTTNVTDQTTWTAFVDGDPVRLIK